MKNIYSNIFTCNKRMLRKAVANLKKNHVIGLPTETVYGLAGNAYSSKSVKNIYKLKKRPKYNPLIIHYFDKEALKKDVILNENFFKLYKKFCPGPITFILRKKNESKINPLALATLKTVAIRFPHHKIIRLILKKISFPLAMPSANISSSISPVCAKDVADEFQQKIKFILDGGKSFVGIESTVVDLTNKPRILRPGIIGPESINKVLKVNVRYIKKTSIIKSPGMLKKHYSPGIPIKLNRIRGGKNDAYITFGKKYKKKYNHFNLSKKSNLNEAASNLYKIMRIIKKKKFKKINVVKIPKRGIGIAINDRLERAARKK